MNPEIVLLQSFYCKKFNAFHQVPTSPEGDKGHCSGTEEAPVSLEAFSANHD